MFFFIATVYLILPSERAAISDEALAVYAAMLLLLGLCLLTGFLFFNSQVAFTNPPDQWRSKIPGLDIAALGTAIPSGLLSFYILIGLVNAYPEDTLPDSQFAVTIPLPAEKIPPQGTDAGARHAVMFWTVDPLESSPHEGLAKMVVACILVMGFGLIYPRLGSEADNDKGLMQGLVIPFIGTILFGAGAVEHADAEELRNDVKLLKHDLPPVRNILDGKREIYITNINELSPIGLRQMQSSLKSLSAKFAKTDFSEKSDIRLVKGDVETLRGELRVVQKTIDAIPNLRIVTAVDPKTTCSLH
ncbi:hypothetical protein C8024_03730 [Sphingopyxis sp. BSNA05]|uniref:hypothetical protein n=1 Tax=Sphingopyxis sp. BSNA05 TaxID=1236614 RepID=UPI001563EFFA|nr:hypothetical protein [Sphingopyxis sp. BSNA05]NRD88756.1 hypothetical protein [Sphingopyxis sp. BSNA05]